MSHIPRPSKITIAPSQIQQGISNQLSPGSQQAQTSPYDDSYASIPNSAITPGVQSRNGKISPASSLYNFYNTISREGNNLRVLTTGTEEDRDSDAIRVVIRVRPMNNLEKQRSDNQSVYVLSDGQTLQIQANDPKLSRPITFNRTFDDNSQQEYVFEQCGVKSLVDRCIEGYNTTVFAFGQTGSGKTFTITGPEDSVFTTEESNSWGIVPRALRYLFDSISQMQSTQELKFTVRACYLEIYNEQVQDLLNPSSSTLPVRWNNERGFYVENLFVVECEVLDDCIAVLEEGLRNRKTGSHRLNEHSSRSHGLMTIYVDSETIDPDDQRLIRKTGKLCFVDLAGSEKVKESQATGDTLTETLNINKSLLTLGNCISALADRKRKKSGIGNHHVPYRDSKLTKLLSDSLGGNGIALMIACVSPSSYNLHETLNTLRYASRAKRIQNRPVVQIDPREELIMQLKKEVKLLRAENEQLRQIVIDFSGQAVGAEPSSMKPIRTPGGTTRFPALVSQSGKSQNNGVTGPPVSSDQSNELTHTKQLLAKFIDENQDIKNQNSELLTGRHQLARENRELMSENDRLIGKIEKLVEIFGSSYDSEFNGKKPDDRKQLLNNPAQLLSNTRLFLLSRRSNSRRNLAIEGSSSDTAVSPGKLDLAKKKQIDRSISEILAADNKGIDFASDGMAKDNEDMFPESPNTNTPRNITSSIINSTKPKIIKKQPSGTSEETNGGGKQKNLSSSSLSQPQITPSSPAIETKQDDLNVSRHKESLKKDLEKLDQEIAMAEKQEELKRDLNRLDKEIMQMQQEKPSGKGTRR